MNKAKLHTEFQPGHGYSKEDWDAIDSPPLTEQELSAMRPAREVLPPEFFTGMEALRRARGRPPVEHPRKLVSIRLDQDVLEKFKSTGKGWQSRINAELRKVAGL